MQPFLHIVFTYQLSGLQLGREPGGNVDPGGAERREVRGGAQEVEPLAARHQGAAKGGVADSGALRAAAAAASEAQEDETEREEGKLVEVIRCSL